MIIREGKVAHIITKRVYTLRSEFIADALIICSSVSRRIITRPVHICSGESYSILTMTHANNHRMGSSVLYDGDIIVETVCTVRRNMVLIQPCGSRHVIIKQRVHKLRNSSKLTLISTLTNPADEGVSCPSEVENIK